MMKESISWLVIQNSWVNVTASWLLVPDDWYHTVASGLLKRETLKNGWCCFPVRMTYL